MAGFAALFVLLLFLLSYLLVFGDRVTVSGRVTDGENRPLSGWTVRAVPQPFSVPWMENVMEPSDPREIIAVTDQKGRYLLKGLSAKSFEQRRVGLVPRLLSLLRLFAKSNRQYQEYEIVVWAPGFTSQKARVSTGAGSLKHVNFLLHREAIVAGRVLDTQGRQLSKRNLRLVPLEQQAGPASSPQNQFPDPKETDDNGAFRFTQVPPGTYRLEITVYPDRGLQVAQASINGVLSIAPGAKLGPRDFFFEAPEDRGGITGRIVDAVSGNSIEPFSLHISHVDSPGAGSPVHGCARLDGTRQPLSPSHKVSWKQEPFLVEDLSPGIATLEISAQGYAPEKTQIRVTSGHITNVTIPLKREGVLCGFATRSGKPCSNGYVHLRPAGETLATGTDTQTDTLGFYEYRGLSAGDYLLRVCVWLRSDSFSAQVTDVIRARVEAGQTNRLDLEFGRSAILHGSFRGPSKRLRWFVVVEDASAQASALPPSDRGGATAWNVERTGYYSFEGLAPGTYIVTAKCLKKDEQMTVVHQKSKNVVLKAGETNQLDFTLP